MMDEDVQFLYTALLKYKWRIKQVISHNNVVGIWLYQLTNPSYTEFVALFPQDLSHQMKLIANIELMSEYDNGIWNSNIR